MVPDYSRGVRISIIVPAFNEELLLAASLVEIENAANAFTKRGGIRTDRPRQQFDGPHC